MPEAIRNICNNILECRPQFPSQHEPFYRISVRYSVESLIRPRPVCPCRPSQDYSICALCRRDWNRPSICGSISPAVKNMNCWSFERTRQYADAGKWFPVRRHPHCCQRFSVWGPGMNLIAPHNHMIPYGQKDFLTRVRPQADPYDTHKGVDRYEHPNCMRRRHSKNIPHHDRSPLPGAGPPAGTVPDSEEYIRSHIVNPDAGIVFKAVEHDCLAAFSSFISG